MEISRKFLLIMHSLQLPHKLCAALHAQSSLFSFFPDSSYFAPDGLILILILILIVWAIQAKPDTHANWVINVDTILNNNDDDDIDFTRPDENEALAHLLPERQVVLCNSSEIRTPVCLFSGSLSTLLMFQWIRKNRPKSLLCFESGSVSLFSFLSKLGMVLSSNDDSS